MRIALSCVVSLIFVYRNYNGPLPNRADSHLRSHFLLIFPEREAPQARIEVTIQGLKAKASNRSQATLHLV